MVEVKRNDHTADFSQFQTQEYMRRVYQRSFSDDFRGYLVMGEEVVVFGKDPIVNGVVTLRRFSMLDDNDPFTRELSQISVNNWNEE